MERLYRLRGGTDLPFNCAAVQLELADLDRLEADIRHLRLPDTQGFFFGDSNGTEAEDTP